MTPAVIGLAPIGQITLHWQAAPYKAALYRLDCHLCSVDDTEDMGSMSQLARLYVLRPVWS